ncbi:MAG TPA: hypothetical protein VEK08_12510 [Planctomycetota bacterium]|nr:hypothetical protein [Planctomycetota bacterium]
MNTRAFHIVIAVQALFAIALIYIGMVARERRQTEYLERTHRVIAGHATIEDFQKLRAAMPADANMQTVRSLFGLPVLWARKLEFVEPNLGEQEGPFWVYYPRDAGENLTTWHNVVALQGDIQCFVVKISKGPWIGEIVKVKHPIRHGEDVRQPQP